MRVGDQVKICTDRPNREQFNGYMGEITALVYKDVAYVRVGRHTPTFFLNELVKVAAPQGGAA